MYIFLIRENTRNLTKTIETFFQGIFHPTQQHFSVLKINVVAATFGLLQQILSWGIGMRFFHQALLQFGADLWSYAPLRDGGGMSVIFILKKHGEKLG